MLPSIQKTINFKILKRDYSLEILKTRLVKMNCLKPKISLWEWKRRILLPEEGNFNNSSIIK
jgi:hypothetical protein